MKNYNDFTKSNETINITVNSDLSKISNRILEIATIILILSSLYGDIGREINKYCISENLRLYNLLLLTIPVSLIFYYIKLSFDILTNNHLKFSINEFLSCSIVVIVTFNYSIYFQRTNDPKVIYMFAIYLSISLITKLIDKVAEYKFWKRIYIEGIKLYGDNFKEYHEVNLKFNKKLSIKNKLDICINTFNFGNRSIIIDLIKAQLKYKKNKREKL